MRFWNRIPRLEVACVRRKYADLDPHEIRFCKSRNRIYCGSRISFDVDLAPDLIFFGACPKMAWAIKGIALVHNHHFLENNKFFFLLILMKFCVRWNVTGTRVHGQQLWGASVLSWDIFFVEVEFHDGSVTLLECSEQIFGCRASANFVLE